MTKTKIIYLTLLFLFYGINTNAQLFDKLKQRAKEKGMETSNEVKYDSTAYDPNMDMDDDEDFEELVINSPEEFFNKDVVMALYGNNGLLTQTSFFDADVIAMRTKMTNNPNSVYHDGEGKVYAFNDDEGRYESMKLLPSSSMGFMTAGMTTQIYKLPQTPYFNAYKALEKIGSGLNFLILEIAFIYKPIHFKDDYYIPEKVSCNGSNDCIRFNYNDPEYPGSYIQFDEQDRLNELFINSTNGAFKDNPTGKFAFSYKNCTVELPDAVELSMVPGPLGKIFNLEKGLEPWKHNKKDKQKNKN